MHPKCLRLKVPKRTPPVMQVSGNTASNVFVYMIDRHLKDAIPVALQIFSLYWRVRRERLLHTSHVAALPATVQGPNDQKNLLWTLMTALSFCFLNISRFGLDVLTGTRHAIAFVSHDQPPFQKQTC